MSFFGQSYLKRDPLKISIVTLVNLSHNFAIYLSIIIKELKYWFQILNQKNPLSQHNNKEFLILYQVIMIYVPLRYLIFNYYYFFDREYV